MMTPALEQSYTYSDGAPIHVCRSYIDSGMYCVYAYRTNATLLDSYNTCNTTGNGNVLQRLLPNFAIIEIVLYGSNATTLDKIKGV